MCNNIDNIKDILIIMKKFSSDVCTNNSTKNCNTIINAPLGKRYFLVFLVGLILFSSIYTTIISGFISIPDLEFNFVVFSILKDFVLIDVYALSQTEVDVDQDLEQDVKNCDDDICENNDGFEYECQNEILDKIFAENNSDNDLKMKTDSDFEQKNEECKNNTPCSNYIASTVNIIK